MGGAASERERSRSLASRERGSGSSEIPHREADQHTEKAMTEASDV